MKEYDESQSIDVNSFKTEEEGMKVVGQRTIATFCSCNSCT